MCWEGDASWRHTSFMFGAFSWFWFVSFIIKLWLWTELLCPPKFIQWNPNPQCDSILRGKLGETTKGWGWSPHDGVSALIRRLERSLGVGNGNPLQYSCLENPMDRGVWWTTLHGVIKNEEWLSNYTLIHARRLMRNLASSLSLTAEYEKLVVY